MATYIITTYGCREYLCRIGIIPGVLDIISAQPRRVTLDTIKATVTEHYCIPYSAMTSANRKRDVARPRQVAMYFAKEFTRLSLPQIGQRFGDRDHTTVIHGVRQIEKLLETDAELIRDVRLIRERLTGEEGLHG